MKYNTAERKLRNCVVGRKTYYGSRSIGSAQLFSEISTMFQTLEMWGLNQKKYLDAYWNACAKAGGKTPDDISEFLPWNMSREKLMELGANPDDISKKRSTMTKKELIKRCEALRKKRTKKQSIKRSMKKNRNNFKKKNFRQYQQKTTSHQTADSLPV